MAILLDEGDFGFKQEFSDGVGYFPFGYFFHEYATPGSQAHQVDQNVREDKELFDGAQKLIGIMITFGQAFAYTWSGMYGPLDAIGAGNAILIVLQLTAASIIITILLDDMMTKGYGIGNSGTSLFIAINMA